MIFYDSLHNNIQGKEIMDILIKYFDFYFPSQNDNLSITKSYPSNRSSTNVITNLVMSPSRAGKNTSFYMDNLYGNFIQNEYDYSYESDHSFNSEKSSELDESVIISSCENDWKLKYANAPKQNTIYDGGVFVCKFMDYLTRSEQITFCQEDMEYFRVLICVELTQNKLLTS